MKSDEFAAKAEEMRTRAETAGSEQARSAFLRAAEGWEALARKQTGPAAARNPEIDVLRGETLLLRQQVAALESAFGIAMSLLRKSVKDFDTAVARVSVEPHPDTPTERADELRAFAQRVRILLGSRRPE